MRALELSNLEIADLCRELALLLHAGVGFGDGLYLLSEEEKGKSIKELLTNIAHSVEEGTFLSKAFEDSGCFPAYITGLLQVGEQSGRTEEALNALSRYYEERERMNRQVKSSLTYPAILLMLMLVVIVILLSQVLPVFNDIYASLGGRLTGIAGGLLLLGQALDSAIPVLCVVMAAGLVFFAAFSLHRGFHDKVSDFWQTRWGDRGIARKMNNARFAQALSMGFSSGLPLEDAVDMAALLLKDIPFAAERCVKCRELLLQGESLSFALDETGLIEASACRLLTLGMRSGTGDVVLEEIARRMQEDARQELEQAVSKVEPALVLVTSVLVGVILLSVMLPLMNIMTVIG